MKLTINTNFPQVARQMAAMRKDIADKALASAMNKTLALAKTAMSKEIRQEFNLSAAYVRDRLTVRRAYARAGQVALIAELIGGKGKKRSANIIAFVENRVSMAQARKRAADGTLKVLRVKIKRGSKKPLAGAFIGNKGRTVFRRVEGTTMASRSKYKGIKHKQKIEPVQTIDVAQMFNTKRINAVVVAMINRRFADVFANEAKFYVEKAR